MRTAKMLSLALATASFAVAQPTSLLRGKRSTIDGTPAAASQTNRRTNFLWWGHHQDAANSNTVKVNVINTDGLGGTASLRLYLHDKTLVGDVSAALAATTVATIPNGETSTTVALYPDMTVEQAGKTYEEMIEPSMYVALDVAASSLTYTPNGPAFDVWLGDTVDLELRHKQDAPINSEPAPVDKDITVNVKNIAGTGGTAALRLYLHDKSTADGAATMVDSTVAQIPDGESSTTVSLSTSMEQAGEALDGMIEPSYYLALDVSASTLTYVDGPAFDIQPGQTVDVEFKPKGEVAPQPSTSQAQTQSSSTPQVCPTSRSVRVSVQVFGALASPEPVDILLYLYDAALADVPAALSASRGIEVPAGFDTSANIVSLCADLYVTQAGKNYYQMEKPSFYIAFANSDVLTYVSGPTDGVQLGGPAVLKLEPKAT